MRPLAAIFAATMIACGPMGVFLAFAWASEGQLARGVIDLMIGAGLCVFGIGRLRDAI